MEATRPAIVIAAHGSKAEGWSDAVEEFAEHVRQTPGVAAAFSMVAPAYLEGPAPRIPDVVQVAIEAGCSEVLVVPLFLTVSTHVSEDLPGVLGLPVPPHVEQRLRTEGHEPLAPGLPVRLLDIGPLAELLVANVERRVALREADRKEEALVLVAYGSTLHHDKWEELMHAMQMRLLEHGYGYAGHAYVGHTVGTSPEPTSQAIHLAAHQAGIRRVHVVPLLVGVSNLQTTVIAAACMDAARSHPRTQVLYAADAILPDGDLAAHVAAVALGAVGIFASPTHEALA